jgi:hypothetical protein
VGVTLGMGEVNCPSIVFQNPFERSIQISNHTEEAGAIAPRQGRRACQSHWQSKVTQVLARRGVDASEVGLVCRVGREIVEEFTSIHHG